MNSELTTLINEIAELRPINLRYYRDALGQELRELQEMADCPQDPVWHAEGDVLTHTQMVMDAALAEIATAPQLSKKIKQSIYLAALLHDVGKPATTHMATDGHIVSPGHSAIGLPMARTILYRLGVPFEISEEVLMLILRHMTAYRMVRRIPADFNVNGINVEQKKYWQLSTEVDMPALYYLTRADWLGRNGTDIDNVLAQMQTFRARCQHFGIWQQRFTGVLDETTLVSLVENRQERERVRHILLCLSLSGHLQTHTDALNYLKTHTEILNPTTAHLYVLIGVPGIGKSTWLANNLPNAHIVSSDNKREELFGDVNWQGDNARVFQECLLNVEQSLIEGATVALDATNIKLSHRSTFLDLANRYQAHTTIVYFDLPLEVALERNQKRTRRVPDSVIARYYEKIELPHRSEAQELIIVESSISPAWR
ncbi:MAG: AAA family ATPase [Acidobacteriota bacterium]